MLEPISVLMMPLIIPIVYVFVKNKIWVPFVCFMVNSVIVLTYYLYSGNLRDLGDFFEGLGFLAIFIPVYAVITVFLYLCFQLFKWIARPHAKSDDFLLIVDDNIEID